MGNYINPSDIDNWPSGTSDAEKLAAIANAEQLVEKITQTVFYEQSFDIELNGNGKNRLFLPITSNILTVSRVWVFGTELPTSWIKYGHSSIMLDIDSSMNELVDGEMDDWNSAISLTYWQKTIAGTSTVNREATDVYQGTYAVRFDIDALNNDALIYQDFKLQPYREYTLSIFRFMSAAGITAQVMIRDSGSNVWLQADGTWGAVATWIPIANALTYTEFSLVFKANAIYGDYRIIIDRLVGTSQSIYIDDSSIKSDEGGGVSDPEQTYRLAETVDQGLFIHGRKNIRVVGTYGYATVPQPIIELCKIMVKYDNDPSLYTSMVKGSEHIGDYSYSIGAGIYSKIKVYTGIFEADKILAIYVKQRKSIVLAV